MSRTLICITNVAIAVTFILVINKYTNALSFFRLGRFSGGNLGEPYSSRTSMRTASSSSICEELWFSQILDHSSPTDTRRWHQRYFVNDKFYRTNVAKSSSSSSPGAAVVFLLIGGEGAASEKWMSQGAWIDYAERFGALLFQLEHRFYGQSRPTRDLSTENLKYLTSEQALEDLANFIKTMNQKHSLPHDVKWIVFGGSYPGSLAAWLRYKYPHLVHGAMSSSGPLLAKLDFKDYFKVVTDSLATYSEECVSFTETGMDQMQTLTESNVGMRVLTKLFKLCDPLDKTTTTANDLANLYESIGDNFAGVVQYNKDNRLGSGDGRTKPAPITIDAICEVMVNKSIGSSVMRLASVNDIMLTYSNVTCLDYKYSNLMDGLRNTSWNASMAEGGRQWMYQTCSEFGFYQTSSQKSDIFRDHFPVDFFVHQCRDVFGPEFDRDFLEAAIYRTNVEYGGLDIITSNVVYVHGSIDPWHALGITKSDNPKVVAIYINGTAHCANMYPKSAKDLPQLVAARKEIEDLIGKWLDQ